jgi:hypothetical protein
MNAQQQGSADLEQARLLVESFKHLFNTLNADTCKSGIIEMVYADNVEFIDCFHHIIGVNAFNEYCASIYQNVQFCQFEFHDEFIKQDSAMLTWTMAYIHPKLNGGNTIYVNGSSHIRFNEKVYHHQDYVDGGALLYEHIPVLKRVIQFLKKRMN